MGQKKKKLPRHLIPGTSKFARITAASMKIAEVKKIASLSGGHSVGSHAAAPSSSNIAASTLPPEVIWESSPPQI
ncbi:unnamed protein product [Arabis nemorensis]|uniref:Uncharacterized protein n=1 Tax=Arabis nemorensis TaxID=586526 RepID=A0A565C9M8_9BRAS|nr:unnamed protein product [Arabis nemorensis]